MNNCVTVPGFDPASVEETLNRWIAHEAAKTQREVTEAIEAYKFNEAAARRLSLRLEHLLRLVCRARQAGAAGRRRARQGRDPRDDRLGAR